jgi:hypothetical protein
MMVEPNPDYYGNKSEFERVTFLYTAEDATVAAARAGQVNMAVVTPATAGNVPEKMQLLAVDSVDNRGIAFPTEPSGKKTESGLAIGNDVTADIAIRKAINIAVDRKKLTEGVLGGYGTPAWGIADGLPWDTPEQRRQRHGRRQGHAGCRWLENGRQRRAREKRQARAIYLALPRARQHPPGAVRGRGRYAQAAGHSDQRVGQKLGRD